MKGQQMKALSLSRSALFFTLYVLTATTMADAIDAAALYHDYCSVCHGDKGDGKSHAMQGLTPPPRNFTSPKSAVELSKERITHAIREGIPGTAMTAWKTRLSEQQITALSDFIHSRFLLPATVETASEGSRIYADYCSVCHGDTGKGALWATTGLSPRPIDFTDKKSQNLLTRERMIRSVSYGRAETAMTGWKNRLTDREIEVVVDYVIDTYMPNSDISKSSKANTGQIAAATPENTKADMSLPLPGKLKGNSDRGAALYMSNCATCHGETGDGRGPRAYFINPKPRDFLHTSSRAMFNRPNLYLAISKGKLRTEMPAWDKVFNEQQLADVSEYVFNKFIKQ